MTGLSSRSFKDRPETSRSVQCGYERRKRSMKTWLVTPSSSDVEDPWKFSTSSQLCNPRGPVKRRGLVAPHRGAICRSQSQPAIRISGKPCNGFRCRRASVLQASTREINFGKGLTSSTRMEVLENFQPDSQGLRHVPQLEIDLSLSFDKSSGRRLCLDRTASLHPLVGFASRASPVPLVTSRPWFVYFVSQR